MPVLSGNVLQFLIADLESEVILRVENRTTDLNRADVWIRDALLEITSDPELRNEFDELEEYGNVWNLTVGTQEYDEVDNIIPVGDINVATLDFLIWQDYPTNTLRKKLILSHYQKADNFQPILSLPTEWYRFDGTIGFTPTPDQPYQVRSRMLKMHPINDDQLNQTTILIPRNWNEILVMAAVERGFIELMEYEKASQIHMLLHGDPKYPTRPGLINGRKKRREKEAWRTEVPLRPVIRQSMYGRR